MTEHSKIVLPKQVVPTHYRITLAPNLTDFTFAGDVSISLEVRSPSKSVTMNAAELEIISASMSQQGQSINVSTITLDRDAETLTLSLDEELQVGSAELSASFSGELNDRLLGFYRSRYLNIEGEETFLAATQFESTDARRAFPCWDEPERKAKFDVTLVIAENLIAVSNMPVQSERPIRNGIKSVVFGTTPIMSTYLLAFVVGDLASIEKLSDSGTLMRVWTTRGNEEHGRFALETSLELLDFYNDYFGIPFPLPKLDHIALPDFAAGAMENWGAITYREVALLVDPENSSAGTRQIVAAIISHEMAHMWFGDLVTMRWWNDLWLNESFASWMGDKAVDAIHPEWEMWTQFLTADTASAFSLDGLANSHPIEQEVNNPAEIGQLFDAISYSKGGSILRMLEDYLGPEDFRNGIGDYLDTHSYGNAETQDLWQALGKASGKPVAKVMDSWTKQTGFPVISAKRQDSKLELNQRRFLYENISSDTASEDPTEWYVPFKVSFEKSPSVVSSLLDGRSAVVDFPEAADGWFKLNPDQTGFYRVSYEADLIEQFKPSIKNLTMSPRDRLGLQGDAYALCRAGYSPVSAFLKLAESYTNETDASVLSDLSSGLRGIDNLIGESDFHGEYQSFCRSIFGPIATRVGWDKSRDEGHLDALFRSTTLSNLGHYGDTSVLAEASNRFKIYAEDPNGVHPDIRSIVFSMAAKGGDEDTYDLMWELEKRTELQEEKVRFHSALASFENVDLLGETLRRSMTDDIRVQDTIRVIVSVASSAIGRSLAWDFVRSNWGEIFRRYGDGGFALMRLVSLVSGFSSMERLKEVDDFFSTNPTPAAERTIEQAKERIQINSDWLKKYSSEIEYFLRSR